VHIRVSARHGHLSDAHQTEITTKAEKLLHFFERITFITVTVDLAEDHKHQRTVEVLVDSEHKHDFVGIATGEDLMQVVIAAIDKVKVQIKHYKEKIQDHRQNPSHAGEAGKRP
jgi:putative sigma-54 modulation protein